MKTAKHEAFVGQVMIKGTCRWVAYSACGTIFGGDAESRGHVYACYVEVHGAPDTITNISDVMQPAELAMRLADLELSP